MMRDPLRAFWNDDIEIDRRQPAGTFGERAGEPVTERGFFDVTPGTTATASADDNTFTGTVYLPSTSADVPLESTLRCGETTVTAVSFRRHHGPKGAPGHLEIGVR